VRNFFFKKSLNPPPPVLTPGLSRALFPQLAPRLEPFSEPVQTIDVAIPTPRVETMIHNSSARRTCCSFLLLSIATSLNAAEVAAPTTWQAQSLGQALFHMLLFGLAGVGAAIIGYKLFDLCTPGNLHHEIVGNRNVAAAIVAASVILGVCLLISAAMIG